jgi:type I restriction enzyme S subunit
VTLPRGWAVTCLGQIASVRNAKADPKTLSGQPFIGLEHIEAHTSRLLEYGQAEDVRSAVTTFCTGDVLYGRLRPYLNKVIEAPFDGCASAELIPLIVEAGIDRSLLRRWIMSREFLAFTASLDQGDRPRVKADDLNAFPILLPPEAEQRRIVAKLDVLTARLARACADLGRVPVLAEHLRQAAIFAVATSATAKTVRFDDVLDYKGGSQPSKSTFHQEMAPGRIRLLQIRDFASDQKAVFIDDNGKWPRCEADDIMIGRYGASVGKILTGKAGAYNVALVKMVFDRSVIDPRFLFHWLKGDTFQGRLRQISRSAQDGFNKEDLAELPFPLLSLAEQAQAAKKADDQIARVDRLEAEAARARTLLDRLDSALLAKAFRGELVPQAPNDEPASVLLDRIRTQRAAAPITRRRRKA